VATVEEVKEEEEEVVEMAMVIRALSTLRRRT